MALKGKIYSIARQHDDLNTNELFQSMIDKSASQDTIVMDGRNIAAGSIFAEQIHANAITADHIKSGAIETDHMVAGTIDVSVLNANQLILPGKTYGGVKINNDGMSMKSTGLDVTLSSSSGFNITDKDGNQLIDIDPLTGNVIMQVNEIKIGKHKAATQEDVEERVKDIELTPGPVGPEGRGVSTVVREFQNSSSGTTIPKGNWSETPNPVKGQYMWERVTTNYTKGTPDVSHSVTYSAKDGSPGVPGAPGSPGTPGAPATSYWLTSSSDTITVKYDGDYDPKTVTFYAHSKTGTETTKPYTGRFIVQTSTDGTSYTEAYISNSNESSVNFSVPKNIDFVKVKLYQAGGTVYLVDEQTLPILHSADGLKGIGLDDKTGILSDTEIYTDKSDNSVVHVEIDGKSVQSIDPNAKNMVPTEYDDWMDGYHYANHDGEPHPHVNRMAVPWLIEVKPNTSYFLDTGNTNILYVTRGYDSDFNMISSSWFSNKSRGARDTEGNMKYIGVSLFTSSSSVNVSNEFKNGNIKPLIQENSNENRDWVEYIQESPKPKKPMKIHSVSNFSLVSAKGKENILINGNFEDGLNKWIHLLGVAPSVESLPGNTEHKILRMNNSGGSQALIVERYEWVTPNQEYTLSWTQLRTGFVIIESADTNNKKTNYFRRGVTKTGNHTRFHETFTIPSDVYKVRIVLYAAPNEHPIFMDLKLEKGGLSPYIPHTSEIEEGLGDYGYKASFYLPQPLRSVSDRKDRLFRHLDGRWGIERRIRETVLNGSEDWIDRTSEVIELDNVNWYQHNILTKNFVSGVGLTSHFSRVSSTFTEDSPHVRIHGTDSILLGVFPPKHMHSSLTEFKNWLKDEHDEGRPLTIHRVLTNPATEWLDAKVADRLNSIVSFSGDNYVFSTVSSEHEGNLLSGESILPDRWYNGAAPLEVPSSTNRGQSATENAIPVRPNQELIMSKDSSLSGDDYWRILYVDKSNNPLERRVSMSNRLTQTVPSGAYGVRVSFPSDSNAQVHYLQDDKADVLSERLKPTLHATFKGGGFFHRWKTEHGLSTQVSIGSIIESLKEDPDTVRITGERLHFTEDVIMDRSFHTELFADNAFIDQLEAKTIDAGQIKTGRLQDKNNTSWIDMNNGEFNFANNGLVYEKGNLTLNGKLNVKNLDGDIPKTQLDLATRNEIDAGNAAKTKTDNWTHPGTTRIGGDWIQTGTLNANRIEANTITANEIAAKTITTDELNITSLAAITANLGTVTAGIIRSKDNAIDINLDTGTINLTRPLTINHFDVSTKKEVEDAIKDIEIGGRNLIAKSASGHAYNIRISDGGIGNRPAYSTQEGHTISAFIKIGNKGANDPFTFSKSASTASDDNFFRIIWLSEYGNVLRRDTTTDNVYTTKKPANAVEVRLSFPSDSSPKLERGNKATDWTPAPEDTENKISNIQTEWTRTFDGFSQTVSDIDGRVSEQKQTIEEISSTVQDTPTNMVLNPDLSSTAEWSSEGTWGGHNDDGRLITISYSGARIYNRGGNFEVGKTYYITFKAHHGRGDGEIEIGSHLDSDRPKIAIGSNASGRVYSTTYTPKGGSSYFSFYFNKTGVYRIHDFFISDKPFAVASGSQISQLSDQINLRVTKGDLLSQINIQAEQTLIQSNKLVLDAKSVVFTGNAFIPSAQIVELDVEKITGETAEFVQAGFNSISSTTSIDADGISILKADGTRSARLGVSGYEFWLDEKEHGTMGVRSSAPGHFLYPKKSVSLYARSDSFVALSYQGNSTDGRGYSALTVDGETGNVQIHGNLGVTGATMDMNGNNTVNQNAIRFGVNNVTTGRIYPHADTNALVVNGTELLRLSADGYAKIILKASNMADVFTNIDMNGWNTTNQNNLSFGVNNEVVGRIFPVSSSKQLQIRGHSLLRFVVKERTMMEIKGDATTVFYTHLDMNGWSVKNQSDYRLKRDIDDTELNSLASIESWKIVDFNWIDDELNKRNGRQMGVIAQDTPDLAMYDAETDTWSINSSKQIMMNSHAIQQLALRERVTNRVAESNEEKIHQLQQELSKANRRIEELESVM